MSIINGVVIKIYNWLISTHIINRNNKICRRVRAAFFHNICHECKASFGDRNQDRVFYVIRCPNEMLGLFGLFNYVIYHLKKAELLNAEPVVDMQYYPNYCISEDDMVGKINCWEFFWKQVTPDVTLEEVYHSKNVIMGGGEYEGSLDEVYYPDELFRTNQLIKKYIHLNDATEQYINTMYKELQMCNARVLGVLGRGTDFAESKPSYHSICANVDQIISKIEEKESEWGNFDLIFLATEDKKILLRLKQKYGDRLIYNQKDFIDKVDGQWLNKLYDNTEYQGKKKEKCLEYLGAIYLLARCDALIASVVGGTLGAMRLKGHYDNCYLFNLGTYK